MPGAFELITPCPSPVTIEQSGVQTVTRAIRSADGTIATTTMTVKLDRGAPRVRIDGFTDGTTWKSEPKTACVTEETYSGLARCTLTRSVSKTSDPDLVKVTYTAHALDKAGNTRERSKSFFLRK